MRAKWKKGFPWILAAIVVIGFALNSIGEHAFHAMDHVRPPISPGFDYGKAQFMYGHHFMPEHHAMSGFHFIGSAVFVIFWLAAFTVFITWLRKRRKARPITMLNQHVRDIEEEISKGQQAYANQLYLEKQQMA